MNKILSAFKSLHYPSQILHLRINFPLWPQKIEECIKEFDKVTPKGSKAIFLSLNGIEQNPENCQLLHDAIRYKNEQQKIPVYSFLQDRISSFSYYVAAPSYKIVMNPFCLMGDLTVSHKKYANIANLLKYFGVNIEHLGKKHQRIWDTYTQIPSEQKQITQKWLKVVENNLKQSLRFRRSISQEAIQKFGSKIISPQEAVELKIVDQIGTLQRIRKVSFPNHKFTQISIGAKPKNQYFTKREVQVLEKMAIQIQAPQSVLFSTEDPLSACIDEFIMIIGQRFESPQKLQELDNLIGALLTKYQSGMPQWKGIQL